MRIYSPLDAFVVDGFPADQVDDTLKLILYADGHLNRSSGHTEFGTDLVDHTPWIRARSKKRHSENIYEIVGEADEPVHLVNER